MLVGSLGISWVDAPSYRGRLYGLVILVGWVSLVPWFGLVGSPSGSDYANECDILKDWVYSPLGWAWLVDWIGFA